MQADNNIQSGNYESKVTLSAKALSKIYQTGDVKVHALRDVDLSLYESELVVLLGASGSGKSTLVNIIGGLDTPTSGQVFFYDDDLTAYNDHQLTMFRRENVGFVFQFYNLIPSLTALENVALVTEISKNPMQAAEALAIVGLTDRINHFPAQLSGGEQQRVAIARAIAKRPSILLCDEPTGALDSKTGILVLEAIERVNQELGTTTILITHNAVISDMADRVITLADGQVKSISENSKRCKPKDLTW
ncbi:MAG: ABC transporter ATP-binding protein [Gammaproteobacteria bacterium]|nr:ABC transporter ATP-binding protein [Gammaproteobacteria bacterium]